MVYAVSHPCGALFLGAVLAVASAVDIRTRTVPGAVVAAVAAVQCAYLASACAGPGDFIRSAAGPLFSGAAVLFLVAGPCALLSLRGGGTEGAGIGGGDVKLLSALGFSMGFEGALACLLAACLAALSYCLASGKGKGEPFPFVPFIALGFACAVLLPWGALP